MTNPNNAIGTNGAFGGRTSVNAFNDIMGAFQSRGVLSGWDISPSSGMTVSVGGSGTIRDVAVAEDASGNKTSVNNISGSPVQVTLDSAPANNARFDAIVVYVDKPPVNSNATQDNPECCGIIPVSGTAASSPDYPSDATIRSAITADGASGATAYYAVVGYVRVASGTTAITSAMITAGVHPTTNAMVQTANIATGAVTSDKIDWTTSIIDISGYAAANVTVNHATVKMFGKLCEISFSVSATVATSSNTTLFVLPSELFPAQNVELPAGTVSLSAAAPRRIWIGTNGYVVTAGTTNGVATVVTSGLYMLP